jgi:hypothetical protein
MYLSGMATQSNTRKLTPSIHATVLNRVIRDVKIEVMIGLVIGLCLGTKMFGNKDAKHTGYPATGWQTT